MPTSRPPRPDRSPAAKKAAAKKPAVHETGDEALASAHDAMQTEAGIETQMYRTIVDGVLAHRLTPGTKLPEPELCQLFDVGRASVRRVLEKLAHDGIVTLRPNKGAVIAEPTPEETRTIFEARRALERALVELAVARVTDADLAQLRKQLDDEHAAMHRFDQPSWARLASDFHLRVAALAGNAVLQRYLVELVSRCSLIVGLYEPPGYAPCEHDEHAAIVECIAQRDAEGAIARMQAHLVDLEQRIETTRMRGEKSLASLLGLAETKVAGARK
ncbi:transcriptional regulator, GntR family [Paraburkholderia tropica]|uniref:Transcriptional regulator, GntR family n=2 Tax=Burkholderiaceae TaxID=119060 RepID=A0AAQ1JUB0_9BURK|nr:DNA-binding GntR family transcriptional regulator [Paraburkholderia tropica]SEJ68810.1 transcriptional regulator, GntR family [Paraburkholderia tropica]